MAFVIDKFLVKVGNAKKQKSSSLILPMAEAQDLSAEIKDLQREIRALESKIDKDAKKEKSQAPLLIDVDGSSF